MCQNTERTVKVNNLNTFRAAEHQSLFLICLRSEAVSLKTMQKENIVYVLIN